MNTEEQKLGFATRCIHVGNGIDKETGALRRPISMGNSFKMSDDPKELLEGEWEPRTFVYTRDSTPNGRYLEERLASLEGGEDCVVVASGMAAMSGIFFTFLNAGDHLISSNVCYISVHELLKEHLSKRFGIQLTMVDTSDIETIKRAVRPNTKMIHIETPGNPIARISDIAEISKIAKDAGALLTVDSTWATPILQQPLSLGADLVMHSLTKYINGHGDSLGGAVVGRKDLILQIRQNGLLRLGLPISPFNAWLVMRGMSTLPLRMRQHCESAMTIARFLESHPSVEFVRYPGLESHPQHEVAKKQMDAFSGMMTIRLRCSPEDHYNFIGQLIIIIHAVSLGHDESLIVFYPQDDDDPSPTAMKYPEDIGKGFLRLSVGLEDTDDLIADLTQAMESIGL